MKKIKILLALQLRALFAASRRRQGKTRSAGIKVLMALAFLYVGGVMMFLFGAMAYGLVSTLRGLGLGADDYIVKPFEILELLARVENVLRRTRRNTTWFEFHDLQVDLCARRVLRGGEEVTLTPQEFALLEALVINRNLALSREKLLEIAWGYDYQGETRTVDVHIQRLRRKLGLEKEIQTVYKIGYRLNTRGEA